MDLQEEAVPKTAVELYCRYPLLSLQEMSILRLATTFCNNQQLTRLIMKCKFQRLYGRQLYTRRGPEWQAVQRMANELVSQMCNCKKLCERIMEYIWPVCYRIMLWKSIYAPSIGNQFLCHFYWTDQGRIDNVRTVKHLIGNKNIPIRKRFAIACSVCLNKEIQEIWQEMAIEDKIYFIEGNSERINPLLRFWADTMEGSDGVSREFINAACTYAFDNGLVNALKYLFAISTEDDRKDMACVHTSRLDDKIFDYTFLEEDLLDILYFLFHEMTDTDRYNLSSLCSVTMPLLLHFSEREHFLNVLDEVLPSLSRRDVVMLFNFLFHGYHFEIVKDNYFRQIFVHIWRTISDSMRSKMADGFFGVFYLAQLIRDDFPFLLGKDSYKKIPKLTSLVSKSCTSETPFGFNRGKWEFLHFFIEEGMVTITALKEFRKDVVANLRIRYSNKAAWNRLLRFVSKVACRNRH